MFMQIIFIHLVFIAAVLFSYRIFSFFFSLPYSYNIDGCSKIHKCNRCQQAHNPVLVFTVIGFGIWMNTQHDGCQSLTPCFGPWCCNFCNYIIMLCIVLVAILLFTVLAFIVTNTSSGHQVTGLRYKEYHLQDYSSWFLKQVRVLSDLLVNFKTYIKVGTWRRPRNFTRVGKHFLHLYVFLCFIFKLNNTRNRERLRSCLVKSDDCSNLSKK